MILDALCVKGNLTPPLYTTKTVYNVLPSNTVKHIQNKE
jgi:hypothetical protein